MLLSMSYDEFDNLIETIDEITLPEGYKFPTLEEADNLLTDIAGLSQVLLAAEKSPDKEYRKALNDLIKERVTFTEDEYEDMGEIETADQRVRFLQIAEKVRVMDFRIPNFCPSKTEIDEVVKKGLAKNNAALGFLVWVTTFADDEDASANMKEIAQYTKKVLEREFKLM